MSWKSILIISAGVASIALVFSIRHKKHKIKKKSIPAPAWCAKLLGKTLSSSAHGSDIPISVALSNKMFVVLCKSHLFKSYRVSLYV